MYFPDDIDKLEEWSDEEIGTEGNTEGMSVSMTERQKKESRGMIYPKLRNFCR